MSSIVHTVYRTLCTHQRSPCVLATPPPTKSSKVQRTDQQFWACFWQKLTRKRPELNPEFRTHIFPGGRADSRSDEMDIQFCLIDIYGSYSRSKVPIEMITAFIIDRKENCGVVSVVQLYVVGLSFYSWRKVFSLHCFVFLFICFTNNY